MCPNLFIAHQVKQKMTTNIVLQTSLNWHIFTLGYVMDVMTAFCVRIWTTFLKSCFTHQFLAFARHTVRRCLSFRANFVSRHLFGRDLVLSAISWPCSGLENIIFYKVKWVVYFGYWKAWVGLEVASLGIEPGSLAWKSETQPLRHATSMGTSAWSMHFFPDQGGINEFKPRWIGGNCQMKTHGYTVKSSIYW